MSAISIDPATLDAETLAFLAEKGLITFEGNGQARAPKAKRTKVDKNDPWTNSAGYTCGNRYLAWTSSNEVYRHMAGICGCDAEKGFTCKAIKKGRVTAESYGTLPNAKLVEDPYAGSFTIES